MTPDEIAETSKLLSKLQPGFLPLEIFEQVARLVVLPVVEVVPFRKNESGEIEVLLLERSPDDHYFSGQMHTPGVVVLATDDTGSFKSAFDRILLDELGGVSATEPTYVYHLLHRSKRGMESAHVHWVEVLEEPKVGAFYTVGNLPEGLIESQREFIIKASKSYEEAEDLVL